MSKKMTIAEQFDEVIAILKEYGYDSQANFIDERKEKHINKNATRKPTKAQEENEVIKQNILNAMESGVAYTVTEIMKAVGLESNQKTSALVRQLKEADLVTRSEIKGKAYFTKA